MEYGALAAVYREIEATQADTEKTAALAALLRDAGEHLPAVVRLSQGRVYPRYSDSELGVSSSLTRTAIEKATGVGADRIEEWWRETGDLGSAAERGVANRTQQTLVSEPLTVERVYGTLRELAEYEGNGSQARKVDAVAGLVSDASPEEARFVVRTALGHLRIGVGDGTVRDALAEAFDVSEAAVERAHQLSNDGALVAETARDAGDPGLRSLDVELCRPIESMLARTADNIEDSLAVGDGDTPHLEYKYDGARVSVHVDGDESRIFTRRLADVTEQFPDAVAAVREAVDADRCILDGELVGYDPDTGDPVTFQRFSKRIKREHEVEVLAEEIPVRLYLFDCLYDGTSLLDDPLAARLDRLDALLDPVEGTVERACHLRPADREAAESFYRAALDAGHEGVMCKNLDAPYTPGRRVDTMVKLKPTMEPLDLVVTRATYSEGRRSEQLGRLYLACYDADRDAFREVGRLSTGYTDEELAALTKRLEPLITERDGRDVTLDPTLVIEVEYEEIQDSPEYDSGFALRFPRFLGVRGDLAPTDADTRERVETLYEGQ